MIDTLDIIRLNSPGHVLSGEYDITLPTLVLHVKNPIGFPIDARRYDDTYIYDQQTEVNWTEPGFIKLHVGNGGKGNRMALRHPTTFPYTISETDSPLYYIRNGQSDYTIRTAGPVSFTWHAPVAMDWGGAVGKLLTYQLDYYWSGVANREQYYYAPPFGLVSWNHANLVKGQYVIDNQMATANVLQTLADWQKTYRGLTSFTYNLPFLSPVPLV